MTTSSRPTSGPAGVPGSGASSPSTRMPAWSSPTPSSRTEQIIPSETWSYVVRAAIAKPPGSTAPGSATTTASPTAKFRAPQTMPLGSASPTSTWQYRIGFLKPISSSISRTRPTTSGPVTSAGRWTSSTSRPSRTKAASRSSTVVPAGTSTCSASQPVGTLTVLLRCSAARSLRSPLVPRRRGASPPAPLLARSSLRCSLAVGSLRCGARSLVDSERRGEPDVALGEVPHVADGGAELQGPLDAHAEREAGVLLRVDAAGDQHPRVDHPAAAPLHPARAVAVLGEPHVELRRGLGEREVRGP